PRQRQTVSAPRAPAAPKPHSPGNPRAEAIEKGEPVGSPLRSTLCGDRSVSRDATFSLAEETQPPARSRAVFNLCLVSVLILFLELACIRWFPAHVLFLMFFTIVVLLAFFLGLLLGCL